MKPPGKSVARKFLLTSPAPTTRKSLALARAIAGEIAGLRGDSQVKNRVVIESARSRARAVLSSSPGRFQSCWKINLHSIQPIIPHAPSPCILLIPSLHDHSCCLCLLASLSVPLFFLLRRPPRLLPPFEPNQSTVAGKEPIVCGAISCGSTQPKATCTSMGRKRVVWVERSRERGRIMYRRREWSARNRKKRALWSWKGEEKPQWRQRDCVFSGAVIRQGWKQRKDSETGIEGVDLLSDTPGASAESHCSNEFL